MMELSNDNHGLSANVIDAATKNINDILSLAIMYSSQHAALIVMDTQCPLAKVLTEAYRRCLPHAAVIDFYTVTQEEVMAALRELVPSDLVVLIQTSSFRLNAFRLRVELFERALKVIEHPHLGRMQGQEVNYYLDSLAYDPDYFRGVGHALKSVIDTASRGVVDSGGEQLVFESPFEVAKLNIGDYTGMKNTGGQFPIGEVFTEARTLESVNGRVRIFAFGDTTFSVNIVKKPITLIVTKGQVTDVIDSTPEFDKVLENIRADEQVVWLRELGFGMNRAFTKDRIVTDIGTYERMCGIHLSLGAKHGMYKKPHLRVADTWHHVDVFADTHFVYLDDKLVYQDGEWCV